jgi:3-phenylpropionate/cinnamic acid dioxygenase small subunit
MIVSDPALAIPNLLYTYAELIDAGDLAGAAHLFRHGHVVSEGRQIEGEAAIVDMWRGWMRLYDGKPRTRHLITNPIIEVAPDGRTAICRSQYTVLQVTGTGALQPIISGRYRDRFARRGLEWSFTERVYAEIDLTGDLDGHLIRQLASEVK